MDHTTSHIHMTNETKHITDNRQTIEVDPSQSRTQQVIYKNKAPQGLTVKQVEEHLKNHGGHIEANKKGIKWESD